MAFGGVTKFPTPAAGGGGGGATFTVEWDCSDAAALPTADWKTTDPSTVNGVSMSSHNDAGTDVCELDGSTGLVMRTTDGHRSLPYNNAYPATMLLADIEDSVGGSWDRYTERCFFQARLNGTTASPQGAGLCMAESLTPLDIDQIFYGTANGSLQYQSEGTVARSNSITVPSDILMEIILGQWGMVRWRAHGRVARFLPRPGHVLAARRYQRLRDRGRWLASEDASSDQVGARIRCLGFLCLA
jgi:hypothetical protein